MCPANFIKFLWLEGFSHGLCLIHPAAQDMIDKSIRNQEILMKQATKYDSNNEYAPNANNNIYNKIHYNFSSDLNNNRNYYLRSTSEQFDRRSSMGNITYTNTLFCNNNDNNSNHQQELKYRTRLKNNSFNTTNRYKQKQFLYKEDKRKIAAQQYH